MSRRKRKKVRPLFPVLIGTVLVVAVAAVFLFRSSDFSTGISYLQKQDTQDIEKLQQKVFDKKRKILLEAIENGTSDPFAFFDQSVFMGDSRVYGFWSYGYFPQERTFAEGGDTIENISLYLDEIEKLKPEYILFSYGVNDMGMEIGYDRGENGYGQVYEEQVKAVLERSPNSIIVLNSIIEPQPDVVAANPRWAYSAELNRQIKEICEKNGWIYVDNNILSPGGTADIYAEDGLHFQGDFYPLWVTNMLDTILREEASA